MDIDYLLFPQLSRESFRGLPVCPGGLSADPGGIRRLPHHIAPYPPATGAARAPRRKDGADKKAAQ